MPTIDSPLLFGLAIGPAMFLAVILHEVGHVVAATCAGIPVAAWGVGYRSPWFYRRIANTTFYLGRPLTGGLTLCLRPSLERRPIHEFILILGGPVASGLGFVVGVLLMESYASSDILASWTYASVVFVLLSSVPFVFSSGAVRVGNDAYQLIEILLRGRENPPLELGQSLASMQALLDLLTKINCEAGIAYYQSIIGIIQASLGNVTGARECLSNAQPSSGDMRLFAFAQATTAVCHNVDDAEQILAMSRDRCSGDATAEFSIDCLHEEWRIGRDLVDEQRLDQLWEQSLAASRRDWLCSVDVLRFKANLGSNDDNVESQCRRLLSAHRSQLNGVTKAWALTLTTERLATQGNVNRAKVLLGEAQAAIAAEAIKIGCLATRDAYVKSAAEPLESAFRDSTVSLRLLIDEMSQTRPGRRKVFAYMALALGALAFTASIAFVFVVYFGQCSPKSGIAMAAILPAVLCALLALVASVICILRSEHNKWPALSTALVLVFLTFAIAVLIPQS